MSVSNLYPVLSSRASMLVNAIFQNCSPSERKEISHDLTVDFLFFSKSFKMTFDPEKGDLLPFFSSYVRRKCRGLYSRRQRDLNRQVSLENLEAFGVDDEAYLWFELRNRMESIQEALSSHVVDGIRLSLLFGLCLISVMECGSVKRSFLAERLKKPKVTIGVALGEMRALMKERL